jgi:hypothetical protein
MSPLGCRSTPRNVGAAPAGSSPASAKINAAAREQASGNRCGINGGRLESDRRAMFEKESSAVNLRLQHVRVLSFS